MDNAYLKSRVVGNKKKKEITKTSSGTVIIGKNILLRMAILSHDIYGPQRDKTSLRKC